MNESSAAIADGARAAPRERKSHVWERAADEWYVEPSRVTDQLLGVERFVGDILDPACGQGNVVTAAIERGKRAFGTDVVRRTLAPWFVAEHDFLGERRPALAFENIITNPPYGKAKTAEAFIRRALDLTPGKVAVFVDVRFIGGAGRAKGLFAEHAPSRIWIITPRPSCPPGAYLAAGNEAQGGTADYCWLVWDRTAPTVTMPPLGWLR